MSSDTGLVPDQKKIEKAAAAIAALITK